MEPLTDRLSYDQRESLEQRIPELRALRIAYISRCEDCARAALSGIGVDAAEQERVRFLGDLVALQRTILRRHDIDPDSMETEVKCQACRDTGFVIVAGIKRPCACRFARQRTARDAQFASFPVLGDFDDSLFSDEEQRAQARRLMLLLQRYVEDFPNIKNPNLLLFGNTGLGKTFYLRVLTRALHDKGVRADLLPAFSMFEAFRRQHLGEGNAMNRLSRLPFLAIDDLGVEPVYRNITVEYFGELLELRLAKHLPIVITTNLDNTALRERYGERILSRLYDRERFAFLGLKGQDLRRQPRD